MAELSLTDQLGAMAEVDELRHRREQVQALLDLPKRRAEAAGQIREYYQSRGIACDDTLVEQGVRQYFDRRLRFEAPPRGAAARLFGRLLASRKRWFVPVVVTLVACVLLGKFLGYASTEGSKIIDREIVELRARLQTEQPQVAAQLSQQREALDQLVHSTPLLQGPAGRQALQPARDSLDQAQTLLEAPPAKPRYQTNSAVRDALQAQADQLDKVREALARETQDAQTVRNRLDNLDALGKQLDTSLASFSAMHNDAAGQARIEAAAEPVREALQALDSSAAEKALLPLQSLLAFARTPLSLDIVDRDGVKSGVERSFGPSGGKSWYLVVEARDPGGQLASLPVTSIESGQQRTVTQFAIRVSQAQYQRVRQDKLEDGHVDDRHVGDKPANTLAWRYGDKVAGHPDMILDW